MASLLGLSDELLANICGFAMTQQYESPPSKTSAFSYPDGVVADHLSKRLRDLLRPMRSCKRLYGIARHQFLESNMVVLNLSDLRMSACRLEHQPSDSQILYTGNPDPLLAQLVHVELVVSISDMRAPFSQPFAKRAESGVLWKSQHDVLSLNKEAANLQTMSRLCRSLRSLHVFLKIDEWILYGRGPSLVSSPDRQMTDAELRYRRLAEAVVEMVSTVSVKMATLSFHHWRGSVEVLDLRDKDSGQVLDTLLSPSPTLAISEYQWPERIARVRSAGTQAEKVSETTVKASWGAADDLQ